MDAALHRHDADRWITCACGARHWGAFGAAGLLLWRRRGATTEVLLQHRAPFSHHGGTWSFPGGAAASNETPVEAALRETAEEALIDPSQVRIWATHTRQHPDWSYTTVIAEDLGWQRGGVGDGESLAVEWIPVDDVATLELLPAFGQTWPLLRQYLAPLNVLLDMANILGSQPNGWWRDRAGATTRLLHQFATAAAWPGDLLSTELTAVYPRVHAVVEGQARACHPPEAPADRFRVVCAAHDGDTALVDLARSLADAPRWAYTSDRALQKRLADEGVAVLTAGRAARWAATAAPTWAGSVTS